MKGMPVWYLPNIPGVLNENATVRDLKITPQGTITFIAGRAAVEVNYDGRIIWQAPDNGRVSKDTSEYYHHEFTRLPNGHYMVTGNEYINRKLPAIKDTTIYQNEWNVFKIGNDYYKRIECGTIIEYDTAKNVVWHWKSSGYLTDVDYFNQKMPSGVPSGSTHLNGFYFDSPSHIYISFRDLNRIIKIEYPSGKLIAEYGQTYDNASQNGLFYGQHSCRISKAGRLYMYNNNVNTVTRSANNRLSISTILELEDSTNNNGDMLSQKSWEFLCDIDTFARSYTLSGGSVVELPDEAFLVSMGIVPRCFIVNREKKVLWNVLTERNDHGSWVPYENYRVNHTSFDALKAEITRTLTNKNFNKKL